MFRALDLRRSDWRRANARNVSLIVFSFEGSTRKEGTGRGGLGLSVAFSDRGPMFIDARRGQTK